jgi:hypothetical protein
MNNIQQMRENAEHRREEKVMKRRSSLGLMTNGQATRRADGDSEYSLQRGKLAPSQDISTSIFAMRFTPNDEHLLATCTYMHSFFFCYCGGWLFVAPPRTRISPTDNVTRSIAILSTAGVSVNHVLFPAGCDEAHVVSC